MERARQPLFIPVRRTACDIVVPRLARLPEGIEVGVGFTSMQSLATVCGPGQAWIQMTESALRALLCPLGIRDIEVDPAPVPAIPVRRLVSVPRCDALIA